jgi:hypothetical protein
MAYTLTTPFPVPNPTKLEVLDVREIDRTTPGDPSTATTLLVELEFRTGNATDRRYGKYVVAVRNGTSSQLRPRSPADADGGASTPYPPGMELQDMLLVSDQTANDPTAGVSTPTGFDTALAAWRTGNSGARRNNLLTELKNLSVIQQGGPLAGAVP